MKKEQLIQWPELAIIDNRIFVYVIARAGVIFGIYFTSCRYSGG